MSMPRILPCRGGSNARLISKSVTQMWKSQKCNILLGGGGGPRFVTVCDRGRGDQNNKNSVTYFMDGPSVVVRAYAWLCVPMRGCVCLWVVVCVSEWLCVPVRGCACIRYGAAGVTTTYACFNINTCVRCARLTEKNRTDQRVKISRTNRKQCSPEVKSHTPHGVVSSIRHSS